MLSEPPFFTLLLHAHRPAQVLGESCLLLRNSRPIFVACAQTSPGTWGILREVPEDFVHGYGYAIATGSATLLSFYQDRCLAMTEAEAEAAVGEGMGLRSHSGGGGGGDSSMSCKFVIDMDSLVSKLAESGGRRR